MMSLVLCAMRIENSSWEWVSLPVKQHKTIRWMPDGAILCAC